MIWKHLKWSHADNLKLTEKLRHYVEVYKIQIDALRPLMRSLNVCFKWLEAENICVIIYEILRKKIEDLTKVTLLLICILTPAFFSVFSERFETNTYLNS